MGNYGKIRHIQKSNRILENRFLNENLEESPNSITVKFNGDEFNNSVGPKAMGKEFAAIYQAEYMVQNGNYFRLNSDEGLYMIKNKYYPLYKIKQLKNPSQGASSAGEVIEVVYLQYHNNCIDILRTNVDDPLLNGPFNKVSGDYNEISQHTRVVSPPSKFEKMELGQIDDNNFFQIIK